MSAARIRLIRETLSITQREMAGRMGLSLRTYNHVEAGHVRKAHVLAAETVAIMLAAERRDATLLLPDLRNDCLALDAFIRGESRAARG